MYEILMFDRCVGSAEVKKEGLYYRFICTCIPPDRGIHRIKVSDGDKEQDLGICVPVGSKFYLTSRVPIKRLKGECFNFTLVPEQEEWFPVASGKPFPHLDKIETARLQITNGRPQIVIDPASDLQDSGLSPEYPNKSELQ